MTAKALVIRRLVGGVIGLLVVLGVLFAPLTLEGGEDEVRSLLRKLWVQVPPPGMSAPAFSLPDMNGTLVRLADLKGQVVMLYFWTTW